ncbi:YihY/virulence factor BrkB family protein [Luteimicrobium subarcticum]|uniref:Membrane protein n=1 Tax=Luteimicrobium subarcticum TaxID=620910 RepID=A0A2M8WSI2_9MICO|nr:YihY/virulence factor BrkB family protein [Luteimicrobium subarcticum]PJI93907.1 membrane protein [Luteimicrobium subarcticum]
MAPSTTDSHGTEDAQGSTSTRELTSKSWIYVAKRTLREFQADGCQDLAAALTFNALLAAAPATVALVSLLGFVGDPEKAISDTLDTLKDFAPPQTLDQVESFIRPIAGSTGSGWALVIGLVLALWSASGFVGAFSRAMNKIYGVPEGRPVWKLRPWMLLITAIVFVLVVLIIGAMVLSGSLAHQVGELIGLSSTTVTVWNIVKWPVVVILVIVLIGLLYWGTPNIKQPKFRWLSAGAVLTLVVGAIATLLFGFYVANASSYNATYGTLAGLFILLLWVYLLCMVLLLGAELDAELERGRELQAGVAAEEQVQLPLRDTKASDKAAEKRAKDIEQARALRASNGETTDADDVDGTLPPAGPDTAPGAVTGHDDRKG